MKGNSAPRLQHNPDGRVALRADRRKPTRCSSGKRRHILKGNFVWDLPTLRRHHRCAAPSARCSTTGSCRASGPAPPAAVRSRLHYQNGGSRVNLTGSPDYAARIRVEGDPGRGCSGDVTPVQNRRVPGPLSGAGTRAGNAYMTGASRGPRFCRSRGHPAGGTRQIQLRVDKFNAHDAAIVAGATPASRLETRRSGHAAEPAVRHAGN